MPHVLQWQTQIERIYNCTQMHVGQRLSWKGKDKWEKENNFSDWEKKGKRLQNNGYHIKSNFNIVFLFFMDNCSKIKGGSCILSWRLNLKSFAVFLLQNNKPYNILYPLAFGIMLKASKQTFWEPQQKKPLRFLLSDSL